MIYIMTAANLYVGDHDPEKSKHLTLDELALPSLEEIGVDHHPGGAKIGTEFTVGVQKLEPTFKLNGWDPDAMAQFGLGSRHRNRFTAYGEITEQRTGRAIEAVAVLEGRLGKVEPDAFKRGELQGHEYAIKSVTHYSLIFDGKEIYYWDFFTSKWRVNGADENADTNRILRIPGA